VGNGPDQQTKHQRHLQTTNTSKVPNTTRKHGTCFLNPHQKKYSNKQTTPRKPPTTTPKLFVFKKNRPGNKREQPEKQVAIN